MWLLIITTTFFIGTQSPTIYQFQEFKTEKRCEDMKKWVLNNEEKKETNPQRVTAECVKN